jgi:hypothetical protein
MRTASGLDEVAVGGARSCSGWFAELGGENIEVFCGEGLPVRREAGEHVARHPVVALAHQQGTEERHGGQQVEPGAPDGCEHQLGVGPEVRGGTLSDRWLWTRRGCRGQRW